MSETFLLAACASVVKPWVSSISDPTRPTDIECVDCSVFDQNGVALFCGKSMSSPLRRARPHLQSAEVKFPTYADVDGTNG